MKPATPVSSIKEGINRRFFVAIETLVSLGKVSSLESFCKESGLSAPRYRELRQTYGLTPKPGRVSRYKYIEHEGLYFLVAKYGISAEWLLTGKGKIFKNEANYKI